MFTPHLKVGSLGTGTRNGRRTAGTELRFRSRVKKVHQHRRKFSGGPGTIDILQALGGGAVIDLHVTISFLPILVNDFSRNQVPGHFLPAALLGKPRHELLANKVGKLLGKLERRLSGPFDQGCVGRERRPGYGLRRIGLVRRRVRTWRQIRLSAFSQSGNIGARRRALRRRLGLGRGGSESQRKNDYGPSQAKPAARISKAADRKSTRL